MVWVLRRTDAPLHLRVYYASRRPEGQGTKALGVSPRMSLAGQARGGRLLHIEQFAPFYGIVLFEKAPYLHADPRRAERREDKLLRCSLFRSPHPLGTQTPAETTKETPGKPFSLPNRLSTSSCNLLTNIKDRFWGKVLTKVLAVILREPRVITWVVNWHRSRGAPRSPRRRLSPPGRS